MKNKKKRQSGLNLSTQEFMISASLADSPKHGYAIAKQVEQDSLGQVKFSAGTLYGSLSNMADSGLIEMQEQNYYQGKVQKVYRLTNSGETTFNEQKKILKNILDKKKEKE